MDDFVHIIILPGGNVVGIGYWYTLGITEHMSIR